MRVKVQLAPKQEQKFPAAVKNPGNKKVQAEQEQVLYVHRYLQAAAFNMPQKARQLAIKSALSARSEQMVVVKDFSAITEPKTKLMVSALKSLNVTGKILIVADVKAEENKNLELSARNIPSVKIILPSNLNVKDLLEADSVVITESAVNDITERLQ